MPKSSIPFPGTLIGQTMGGPTIKARPAGVVDGLADGSWTNTFLFPVTCVVLGWGAGGANANGSNQGAGGGGCGYKLIKVMPGQTISWTIGLGSAVAATNGGDTIVTLPRGAQCLAGGGLANGTGGVCSGSWDTWRPGGRGGLFNTTRGESPVGGGLDGGNNGSGGGAAGFSDLMAGTQGGNGGSYNSGSPATTVPGGALGGSSGFFGSSKAGAVKLLLVRE
ncbi:hypothetical protein UFOVP1324_58 [uncultured Caudovirales phage]|uniref:Uncharacterized protein n=1 Tax=uncultured Caudovirales phage TaxID=2100421 RepID=A0A6J5RYF4_9CAUD|nr:hypothetical protein UFOVP1324_58 [uncultured Caudovirales phage]